MALKITAMQPVGFMVALSRVVLRDLVLWKALQEDHDLKAFQEHYTAYANHCGEEFAPPGVDDLASLHRKYAQYLALQFHWGDDPERAMLAVFRFLIGNSARPIDWISGTPEDRERQQEGFRIHAVDESPIVERLTAWMQEAAHDPHRGTLDAVGVYVPGWMGSILKRPTDKQYFMGMVKATTWVGMFDRDLYQELAEASPLFIPSAEDGLVDPPRNTEIDDLLKLIKRDGSTPWADTEGGAA